MPQDRAADQFRAGDRTAGRIDPHNQRGEVVIQRVVEQAHDPLRAGRARSGIAVGDFTGNGDHSDRARTARKAARAIARLSHIRQVRR